MRLDLSCVELLFLQGYHLKSTPCNSCYRLEHTSQSYIFYIYTQDIFSMLLNKGSLKNKTKRAGCSRWAFEAYHLAFAFPLQFTSWGQVIFFLKYSDTRVACWNTNSEIVLSICSLSKAWSMQTKMLWAEGQLINLISDRHLRRTELQGVVAAPGRSRPRFMRSLN